MNKKLWQKDDVVLHPSIEKYTVGEDFIWDKELFLYDVEASQAHAKMLEKIGIISGEENEQLQTALGEIKKDWEGGKIEIKIEDEDCHTVIENYLVEKLGDVGKKIHTGRSRNDQVLVAMRLYMKNKLKEVKKNYLGLAQKFFNFAKSHEQIPLPGYSHTQQAMLSSVGHYMASILESILDDIDYLDSIQKLIDKNPLGSAAGFGVNIPLDRKNTTENLGFASIQVNSLYCQAGKGKYESMMMEGLSQVMMTMSRFATDMLFFTSQECKYFSVHDNIVTGSSIMPHKKNLDVLEIVKGQAEVISANQMMLKNLNNGIVSGYNRQSQLMKKPLFESIKIILDTIEVVGVVLKGIKPNGEEIKSNINKDIFMADYANELVLKENLPFRDAYKQASEKFADYEVDVENNLKSKVSLGAAGNLDIDSYKIRIDRLTNSLKSTTI